MIKKNMQFNIAKRERKDWVFTIRDIKSDFFKFYLERYSNCYSFEFQNTFITPKRNSTPIKHSLSILPYTYPMATTNVLSVFMNLTSLHISYKRNHTICGF